MRFPFWTTAWRALASLAGHHILALRIAAPWLLVCTALQLSLVHIESGLTITAWWQRVLLDLASPMLTLACGAVPAVEWHRAVILQDVSSAIGLRETLRRAGRYVLVASLILLVPLLPLTLAPYAFQAGAQYAVALILKDIANREKQDAPATQEAAEATRSPDDAPAEPQEPAPSEDETSPRGDAAEDTESEDIEGGDGEMDTWADMADTAIQYFAAFLLLAVALSVLCFAPARWSLALPAIANGRRDHPLSQSWALSRGNTWPLLGGILLAYAIVATIHAAAFAMLEAEGQSDTVVNLAFVQFAVTAGIFIGGLFWAGFLSHAERQLTEPSALQSKSAMLTWSKIPFWSTLGRAHSSVVAHWREAAAIPLPTLVVFCASTAALSWWRFDATGGRIGALDVGILLGIELVGVLLGAVVAVKWHRLLLLGEAPSWRRWPPQLLPYLMVAVVVWAAMALPLHGGILIAETAYPTDPQEAKVPFPAGVEGVLVFCTLSLVLLPPAALLSYLPLRFSLALPAIAVGVLQSPLARSWELSRFWRLFWDGCFAMHWQSPPCGPASFGAWRN